ncbi:MAG: hypothetical protein ABW133_14125 [Polyangiaceae bacterium]
MTKFSRDSLLILVLAATVVSGCSDDPAQPGTGPDSGSPRDDAPSVDSPRDDAPSVDATPVDAAPCPQPGHQRLYDKPGCGGEAPAPVCRGVGDACANVVCSCDGVTLSDWCEGAKSPFAYFGACKDGGDASTDADGSTVDADANDVSDASDSGDADAKDGDAPVYADADATSCTEIDAALVYDKAGCGVNTPAPVCRGSGDACLNWFCGCDGVTFTGACNWASKPFAHFGACPDGGGLDASGGG